MYWWMSAASARAEAEVVAERLLDDNACGLGQTRLRQALDHGREQERRDLEIEDRPLRGSDRLGHSLKRARVAEVALDVREPSGEALEDRLIDGLSGALDRRARVLAKVIDRPIVHGHTQHRAVQQPAPLEAVQRAKGHDLGKVAGDAEGHEHVGLGSGRSMRSWYVSVRPRRLPC